MRPAFIPATLLSLCLLLQPFGAVAAQAKGEAKLVGKEAAKKDAKAPAEKDTVAVDDTKNITPEPQEKEDVTYNSITLRGLNKVTARSSLIDGPIGTVMRFGNLEMVASRCWQSPPEEQPENAALLEIWELKPNEAPATIFSGWMFSSSPGLSALQHPVYDITVVSCNQPQENTSVKETPKADAKSAESGKAPEETTKNTPEDEPDPNETPLD